MIEFYVGGAELQPEYNDSLGINEARVEIGESFDSLPEVVVKIRKPEHTVIDAELEYTIDIPINNAESETVTMQTLFKYTANNSSIVSETIKTSEHKYTATLNAEQINSAIGDHCITGIISISDIDLSDNPEITEGLDTITIYLTFSYSEAVA